MSEEPDVAPTPGPVTDVVNWYTRARKFPQVIGKTPSGSRLWGGPYSASQIIVGFIALIVGSKTMPIWAHSNTVVNWGILIGVSYGACKATGYIPLDARSPRSVGGGLLSAVSSGRWGEHAGRKLRHRRPLSVRGSVVVATHVPPALLLEPSLVAAAAPEPPHPRKPALSAGKRHPDPVPLSPSGPAAARPAPALSGVQLLLAQAAARPDPPSAPDGAAAYSPRPVPAPRTPR